MELDRLRLFADLGYTPHAIQREIHLSKAPRRIVAGGTRLGKSMCAAFETIAGLLEPRESTLAWLVAPTYDLTERIFNRVVMTVQAHIPHMIKELDLRERRLVMINLAGGRSELRAKSADNPTSLLGEALDFLVIDEAGRLRADVWSEYLAPRLIDRRGWLLMVSTPGKRDWFWFLFRRGLKNRDPAFQSWSAPSWDNPHIDRELIEGERKGASASAFKAQYGAEFEGPDLGPCTTCGLPDSSLPSMYFSNDVEDVGTCADCGWPVDSRGHTTINGFDETGRPWVRTQIIFEERLDGTPSYATHCIAGVEYIAGTGIPAVNARSRAAEVEAQLRGGVTNSNSVDRPEGEIVVELN
jgi:hypothetical protein